MRWFPYYFCWLFWGLFIGVEMMGVRKWTNWVHFEMRKEIVLRFKCVTTTLGWVVGGKCTIMEEIFVLFSKLTFYKLFRMKITWEYKHMQRDKICNRYDRLFMYKNNHFYKILNYIENLIKSTPLFNLQ